MEAIRQPYIKVLYNSRDITADVSRYLLSCTYTDKVEGESDEVQFTLEDTDGLWRGPWYPDKGATLTVTMGYPDQLLECGVFEIDEIELSGPPDTVSIRALAAGIKSSLRTHRSDAHEGKTLRQIALKVAQRHGLTITGTIPNVTFQRVTQSRSNDLAFLRRIASEYGCLFSVRGSQLVFTTVFDIEAASPVTTIDRLEVRQFTVKDSSVKVYKDAKVKYHNPKKNEVVESTFAFASEPYADAATGDTKVVYDKAENTQQAELKAKAALHRANSKQQEGSLSMEGHPLLVSGVNFDLTGFGRVSGKYHVVESTHQLDRSSGYTTEVTIKRVGFVDKAKEASTRRKPEAVAQARQPDGVQVVPRPVDNADTYRNFFETGAAASTQKP